jgi:hypothetical protein
MGQNEKERKQWNPLRLVTSPRQLNNPESVGIALHYPV